MRGNSKAISSVGRSESLAYHEDLPLPVAIRPLKSARRFRLRFDPARNLLKLTCPARASRRVALAWAVEQRQWVEAQLATALPAEPFVPGARFPLNGTNVLVDWREDEPRAPRLHERRIICGGPRAGLARRIELFLRRQALDTLSTETAHYAEFAGVSPKSVSVGDADTRWGSCSSEGRIRFSWRLVLAPASARRYVVAHEVAHLVHLNHGAEFKALETRLFGDGLAEARDLLWRIGPRLRRIGRGNT